MPHVEVTLREGAVLNLESDGGLSVMEITRDGGVDEMIALCGGCCSCANCHIFVAGDRFTSVGRLGLDEDALLASSGHCGPTSRISCQPRMSPELDGLCVTIAPED